MQDDRSLPAEGVLGRYAHHDPSHDSRRYSSLLKLLEDIDSNGYLQIQQERFADVVKICKPLNIRHVYTVLHHHIVNKPTLHLTK